MEKFDSKFQQNFVVKKHIGQGTFGKVQKCIEKSNNKIVAVKIIDSHNCEDFKEEAELMMKVKSDYTLELLDHFYDDVLSSYVLILPFYSRGNLSTIMNQEWTVQQLLLFLYQIQKAFIEINKNNILHLDLKPDNILIKNKGQYVVCDFGCAKHLEDVRVSNCLKLSISKGGGTTDYAAPEVITKFQVSKYSDIWSLGVIAYQILYKCHPLKNKKKMFSMAAQDFTKGKLFIQYPQKPGFQKVIDLTKKMLTVYPRLTWQNLGAEIHSILGISQRIIIVTDISQFINYASNVNAILSGLIYYIDLNHTFLSNAGIETKGLIEITKMFMMLHIESVQLALREKQKNQLYYIFPVNLKSYTEDMSDKVKHILQRTIAFTKDIERTTINNYLNIKQTFQCDCNDFHMLVKKKQNTKPQNEWHKVLTTLECIKSGIDYRNKNNVKKQKEYLVYN